MMIESAVAEASSSNFDKQALTVLFQDEHHLSSSVLVEPKHITDLVGIQRSTRGQIYYVHSLEKSLHFSLRNERFHSLVNLNYGNQKRIPYLFIGNGKNYNDNAFGVSVINKDDDLPGTPIKFCTDCVIQMFRHGLASAFTNNEKKRGHTSEDTSSTKNKEGAKFIPTISLGFTTLVTQEYKNSRSSICGNVRPFLRNGNMPVLARPYLLRLVKKALQECPIDDCFDVDNLSESTIYKDLRKDMIGEFEKLLGGVSYSGDFRVEGIAILIPSVISDHRDVMNCMQPGMNHVVGIHMKVPMSALNESNVNTKHLRSFVQGKGYQKDFPVAVILYSRRVVHMHVEKMCKITHHSDKDALRRTVFWALTKRVNHVVDLNHLVFDNVNFQSLFDSLASIKKSSKYRGHALRTVASYNKMVSNRESIIVI